MSEIREKAVEMAKEQEICTQCLKHPVAEGMLQCQACIDRAYNKRKKNEVPGELTYSQRRTIESIKLGRCTKCNSRKAKEGYKQCQECLDKDKERTMRKYGPLSEEHRKAIGDGIRLAAVKRRARKEGRKKAFEKKDDELLSKIPKRKYEHRISTAPVQMQSMIAELEMFIAKLPQMTAAEYLEKRELLIKNILIRGGK